MDFTQLDATLRDAATDLKLDDRERSELRELGARIDADRIRYLRNRAFDMARELIATPDRDAGAVLRWLEQVVRTLDLSSLPAAAGTTAFFSPGDSCLNKLRELCRGARTNIDACVFTIADDRLSNELAAAHKRGVVVRIISDNDKRFDDGSDIARLAETRHPGAPGRLALPHAPQVRGVRREDHRQWQLQLDAHGEHVEPREPGREPRCVSRSLFRRAVRGNVGEVSGAVIA